MGRIVESNKVVSFLQFEPAELAYLGDLGLQCAEGVHLGIIFFRIVDEYFPNDMD